MAVTSIALPGRCRGGLPADIDDTEMRPRWAGLTSGDIDAIWRAAKRLYRSGAYPGLSLCVRRRGQVVLNRSLGYARGNGPGDGPADVRIPLTVDAPICLYSASKAITAILVHKLAEEGGIDLDAPVARYLPRFGGNGKAAVTISEVLSHRAGFASLDLPRRERNVQLLADPQAILDRIYAAPLRGHGHPAYHALTGGFVMGELIERVTGKPLRDYLDSRLRQPLGMTHFTYGLPASERHHVARNYVAGMRVRYPVSALIRRALFVGVDEAVAASNEPAFMDAVIPAGNLYATAEELSRFYQMLLDGGEYQGRRLLAPETVQRALIPRNRLTPDRMLMVPMRYSEGFMLGARGFSLYGPDTADAYGHLGFMNILGWAQPSRQLAVALLTTGKSVLGPHLLPLERLLATLSSRAA